MTTYTILRRLSNNYGYGNPRAWEEVGPEFHCRYAAEEAAYRRAVAFCPTAPSGFKVHEKSPAAPICSHCEEAPATHVDRLCSDSDAPACLPCLESAMQHGHKHTHDTGYCCRAEFDRLDGSGADSYACPGAARHGTSGDVVDLARAFVTEVLASCGEGWGYSPTAWVDAVEAIDANEAMAVAFDERKLIQPFDAERYGTPGHLENAMGVWNEAWAMADAVGSFWRPAAT